MDNIAHRPCLVNCLLDKACVGATFHGISVRAKCRGGLPTSWLLCVVALLRVADASHGLWKDPYGREVISDTPTLWWRLDNATRGGLASCSVCDPGLGAGGQCLTRQAWCEGSYLTTVSSVAGIAGSGTKESVELVGNEVQVEEGSSHAWDQGGGYAARIEGGAVIQFNVAAQLSRMSSFSLEVWVRLRRLTPFEQSIVSAGELRPCDGVQDALCSTAAEGVNHGFELAISTEGLLLARIAQLGPASSPTTARGGGSCNGAVLGRQLLELRGRTLPLGAWTFAALTVDFRHASLYVNAVLAAQARSNVDAGPFILPVPCRTPTLLVGGSSGPRPFPRFLEADVDELAVYARALPQARLVRKLAATRYDDNVLSPHSNCSSPPQTHTNPVQSCAAAQEGLKRINRRGNVPSESAAEPAGADEGARLDQGAADHVMQGPRPWPVTSTQAGPAGGS